MIRDAFIAVSMIATPATIILSGAVVCLWIGSAINALLKKQKTEYEWLVMGVVIGFIGSTLDNFYWMIPWTLEYWHNPLSADWFDNGVYANLPFRQTCGILAAYCHIRSALMYAGDGKLKLTALLVIISTITFSILLFGHSR